MSLYVFMIIEKSIKGMYKSMFNGNEKSLGWKAKLIHKCFYLLLLPLVSLAFVICRKIFSKVKQHTMKNHVCDTLL